MISDAAAAIIAGLIGGVLGLIGVWIGFYLSRRAAEGDRRIEALFTIYQNVEFLRTLLLAYQRQKLDPSQFHAKWTKATENVLIALVRSGLKRKDKKRVLHAINGKWSDARSISQLSELADDLLERVDADYARACKELLDELGAKIEDIEPIIVRKS